MIQQHLHQIRRGVLAWNTWRDENLYENPDLSRANLIGINLRVIYDQIQYPPYEERSIPVYLSEANLNEANLTGADLRGADLRDADFTGADLTGADLTEANLTGANLTGANLTRTDFSNANLADTNLSYTNLSGTFFTRVDLRRVKFTKATFTRTFFHGANLANANLNGINLDNADFSESRLNGADLGNTWICNANLREADLTGANLIGARLIRSSLRETNLTDATLTDATLSGAFLINTNLTGANFSNAYLGETNFNGTQFKKVDFSNAHMELTTFGNIDFRGAKGLDTIKHSGPSTIGIDSFLRSEGNIPEIFLRQAGVAESAISYARSLNNMPVKYYSCLICYSHQDQEFAERLYADLQQKGIRCWYAPAGMTTGLSRSRIRESTNLYDRLLLVFSRHSLREDWFAQAVREILAEETKRSRQILFPIRLDSNTSEQKGRQIYNYNIPFIKPSRYNFDFTHWKHHENYQQVLNQLVQCLQSDSTLYKSKGEADQQQEQKQKRPPRPWKSILYEAELRATLDPHLAEIEIQKFREQEGKTPEELAKLLGLPIEDVTPYEPPPPPPVVVEYDDEGFEIDAFGLEKKQEQE